ncbi:MAG: DUF3656 domain-containing protein, partial [Clostridia bacterium]|nr:DUF3656 domain-containing protein [Clostridia bacterium]
KIEGRLKKPEYVAVVTSAYRRLLDGEKPDEKLLDGLRQVFNRGGFTQGYFEGIKDGEFLSTQKPGHRGVPVGKADVRTVCLSRDVDKGDALAVRDENGEDAPIKLAGRAGERVSNPAKVSGTVYRMQSKALLDEVNERLRRERGCVKVSARMELKVGEPAMLTLSDGENSVTAEGECVQIALNAGANDEKLLAQLRKTGGTPYIIDSADINSDANAYLSAAAVNSLRREALDKLAQARISAARGNWTRRRYVPAGTVYQEDMLPPRVAVQGDDARLLRRLLNEGADEAVYFPSDLRPEALENAGIDGMFLYLPPVMAGDTLEKLHRFAADKAESIKGVYISNAGQLALEWPRERRFDFSMNIFNNAALDYLDIKDGIYTPSIELTCREIRQMRRSRELIVYGRVPLMHLRHCPLNALRGGGLHRECRACDGAKAGKRLNDLYYTDRTQARFPFKRLASNEGCVIDLLNSVPMNLLARTAELLESCVWRLLLTDEDEMTAVRLVRAFKKAALGEAAKETIIDKYTTGHYFRITE